MQEATLEPMYATIGGSVPEGAEWVFEPKYDGVRVLAVADAAGVRLLTRNGRDKAAQFPEVVRAVAALAQRGALPLVLDGELVALQRGRPARFQALQERVHLKDPEAVAAAAEHASAALVVFDLLCDGPRDLTPLPWSERREALERRLPADDAPHLRRSEVLATSGERALRQARQRGWEGVIAKRRDSVYRPGRRSDQWLKLKIEFRQEFVVGGWTDPQRSRPHLGSLLVGYYQGETLVFAGGVGTGFDRRALREMRERLAPLEREEPPFVEPPRTRTPAHWVHPEVVVEIRFTEWTADGRLRHPTFVGVRDDKPARQVTREGASVQRG